MRPSATEHAIGLNYLPESAVDPVVFADSVRLKQVLLNLVSNAINYNRSAGSVVVSTEETDEGRVRITISDTGWGIAADKLDKLFVPFERLGAEAGSVREPGSGSSSPRVSSRRWEDSWPWRAKPVRAPRSASSCPASGEGPYRRLSRLPRLSPSTRPYRERSSTSRTTRSTSSSPRAYSRNYGPESCSAQPPTASSGSSSPESQRPDLVLLDLNLPSMTGEEVLTRLRAHPGDARVAVVVVSADSTSRNLTRLLHAGADAYLTKPFDLTDFLEIVDAQLTRAQARRPSTDQVERT